MAGSKEEKWNVVLSKKAAKSFEAANAAMRRRFGDCLDQLESDPFTPCNAKPLTGPLQGFWRSVVGGWRIIYQIDRESRTVAISVISPRGDVYKK
jgi:mRNA-degrading endonuclease RelE of RelBE toxin-antitoxin system